MVLQESQVTYTHLDHFTNTHRKIIYKLILKTCIYLNFLSLPGFFNADQADQVDQVDTNIDKFY